MNQSDRRAAPSLHEEASRYALLRRLTPTLRHHMAGEFQPIGMMAALAERRLQQANPDLASLKDNCASIGNLSRNAAETCANLMSWVAPRTQQDIPVSQAVAECVDLLATSLRFRGFVLANHTPEIAARVPGTALRSTLTAALLAMSDAAGQSADLQVQAHAEAREVVIELSLAPSDRTADNGGHDDYRALSWDDVQVLADAEGVRLERGKHSVRLTLPVQPG